MVFWGALLLTLPAVFSATMPALFSGAFRRYGSRLLKRLGNFQHGGN